MARMPLLAAAAAAAGGRRRLVDLCATAPSSAGNWNWQEPLGQDSSIFPPWSSWSRGTKIGVLFWSSAFGLLMLLLVFCYVCRRFCCRGNKDDEQDTSSFVPGPLGMHNDDAEGVSAPPPWQLHHQEQQPLPASGDGRAPPSNSGEGDRPLQRQRRRRQRQPPAVAEVPAGNVELAPLGDVQLTPAGVAWALANLAWAPEADVEMAPAADVEMAPAADEEVATAPEPAPTLKCTFSTEEGWTEGTCSVCLSELVDGEKVRVLTACMHCFHASCVETWLRTKATCPLCRAPAMAVPARGRRRRRMTEA